MAHQIVHRRLEGQEAPCIPPAHRGDEGKHLIYEGEQ